VYMPFSMEGKVYCHRPDGTFIWKNAASDTNMKYHMNAGGDFQYISFTELAVTDTHVFMGCQDGALYAFDAEKGERLWSYKTDDVIATSSPSVAGGLVYFGSWDGNLYAIDTAGKLVWRQKLGGRINSSPCPGDGIIYVGCDDGKVYAIH